MSESLIDQYCRIVDGGVEFDDPRLQQLRERMTDAEVAHVVARLRSEAADLFKEADLLRYRSPNVVSLRQS